MSKQPIPPPPSSRPIPIAPRPLGALARALRHAADAHHQHEEQTGRPDPAWPYRYALHLEGEQAGPERVPAFLDGLDGLDGTTVPVAVVTSRTEAELIVGMLRNNDLSAAVSADDAGGQEPELQLQGVRVLVAPSDEAAARRLLAAAGDTPLAPASPAPFSGVRAGLSVPEGADRRP